tara:strand:- start:148 stop:1107 length:960 start_codon:yes stop_codon:yes gene_type:complete
MTAILTKNALLLCLLLPFAANAQETIDESRSVSANERVYIEVMRGTVRIRASDDNLFRVRGTLDERAEGYTLESNNGFTRFEVEYPRSSRGWGWNNDKGDGSELEIEIPAGSELEFESVNGDVDVMDISGSSSIKTVNGDIVASSLSSFVELGSVNGDIESNDNSGRLEISTVNGEVRDNNSSGRIEYDTVNGEIRASSSATEVSVSTVNGEAELALTGTEVLAMGTVNGDIDVRLANSLSPRIEGSTVSGDIRLELERDINASFDISAHGGDIENDMSDARPTRDKYGPRKQLNFSTGNGSGSVEITTVNGDIELVPL